MKRKVIQSTLKKSSMSVRQQLPRHKQLKALKVKDITLCRYDQCVTEFKAFARRRRLPLKNISAVDLALCEYFADLLDSGEPQSTASYTLFGYLMLVANENLPDKLLLPRARASLRGWASKYPHGSRTGADPLIWYLLAECAFCSNVWVSAAILLQLDTYARPSEILRLRKRDVVKPCSGTCKFWGVIMGNSEFGERTKTGTQDDTVLLDSSDREYAPVILEMLFRHTKSMDDFLFPGLPLSLYESELQKAKAAAGLNNFQLTPHSIRHSGPSIDFLQKTRGPEQILARGRWRTLKSIQRYQKPGQMMARMSKIPQHVWERSKRSLQLVMNSLKKSFNGGSPQ